MPDRCDFTDLPADQCGHCKGLTPEPPTRQRVVTTSAAVFASRCAGCDGRIEVGDRIALLDRDGWICGDCEAA